MIFVTVGAQMPFDRLVRAVDAWAAREGRSDVFAQIGPTRYRPPHLRCEQFLDPPRFRAILTEASLVVAHAGMGTIISALEIGRPILVMPRRGDLAETRNDHQVATARRFGSLGAVEVAMDEHELAARLAWMADVARTREVDRPGYRVSDDVSLPDGSNGACRHMSASACPNLLRGLQAFIHGQPISMPPADVLPPVPLAVPELV